MPIPSMEGLGIAMTGLNANQEAIDVAGQNIANAQTPGYTRQTAVLQTAPTLTIQEISASNGEGAKVGTGVEVQTITQVRDKYLDSQYRNANSSLGSATTLAQTLEQVQSALQEPTSSGLSARLSSFWSAWNSLAAQPTSGAAREAVISAGGQVATALNQLSAQISGASTEARERYEALTGPTGEVHEIANQIAELNTQIKLTEQGGLSSPNEMFDQRNKLIDELSKLGSVSVSEGEYGELTVSFGNAAKPLVKEATVEWPQTLTSAAGGELGALLSLSESGGKLAKLGEALDQVTEALAESVNALQPRAKFFSFTSGSAAATIAVAVTGSQIQTGAEGQPGANSLAVAVSELRGGEAEALYTGFVSRVGGEVKAAKSNAASGEALRTAVTSQRQSVSGVSVDEEMTHLLMFQRGFEASARALTAMDQLLETLIEHTGMAGL